MQPERPDFHDKISVIEDLEPEHGGPGWRLDLLLGIPLLLAVVLFAGWQWWRQDYQSSQYQAGHEAAGRNDWEAARRYFTEASDYSDAGTLAKGASEKITERDRLYSLVVAHSDQGNWLLALRDSREAAKIQPDYRDLPEREQTALNEIYGGILSGTVTLRTAANPPGLYYRTAGGWTYLQGSDSYSAVRTAISGGQFVYDGAEERWTPRLASNSLSGRRLVYAHHVGGAKIEYLELSLDPSYYTHLLAGSNGIWGIHYRDSAYGAVGPVVRSPFINTELAYQPYSMAPTATVGYAPMPRGEGTDRAVMYIDRGSNRYLMADWSNAHTLDVGGDTVVNLYIAVAGKGNARLIYTHKAGGIISAQLSPDGRYVMLHTFTILDVSYSERQSILLIDLQDTTQELTPRVILDLIAPVGDSRGRPSSLGCLFVRDGPFAGDIVLSQFLGDRTWLQVLDATHSGPLGPGTNIVARATVNGADFRDWLVDPGHEDGLLITGHDYRFEGVPPTSTLSIISITPAGAARVQDFAVASSSDPRAIKSGSQGVAWSSYEWQTQEYLENLTELARAYIVYSAQSSQPARGVVNPTLAYRQTFNVPATHGGEEPGIVLGDSFFAYTYDGQLHLRSYDGADDLILESGVQSLEAENRYRDYWAYLRR